MASINIAPKAMNCTYLFSKDVDIPTTLTATQKSFVHQCKSVMQTAIINKIPERYTHHINVEEDDSLHQIIEAIKKQDNPINQ